jgi:hypothetical protein
VAAERTVKQIVSSLVQLDERGNLDSLPEVQAMRQIIRLKQNFDEDSISRLCVAAGLNDYQEPISANPEQGSFWGRFVDWAVNEGEGVPPWRRFPNVKARRFERFRKSNLWEVKLLEMDSGQVRVCLAGIMRQNPLHKTICFAPLVLARWAYVLDRPFTVVRNHPIPMDSRVSRFLESVPGLDPHSAIETANETRRTLGLRELNMSDFDAWAWQIGT